MRWRQWRDWESFEDRSLGAVMGWRGRPSKRRVGKEGEEGRMTDEGRGLGIDGLDL